MLQYLLNATAIWMVSMLSYDIFLQKESYHAYNRFFLLFTFLIGILLPLVQWSSGAMHYTKRIDDTVEQIVGVKSSIVAKGSDAMVWDWQRALMIVYITGCAVALLLLIRDVAKMIAYYHSGKKSGTGDWTVIETGKEHAPFSFMNMLFVSSKRQYSDGEWNMISMHERRHTSLLHVADLMLMQLARVAFWFHPLVYMYDKRLMLVHEYQADAAGTEEPGQYGHFLIEQALLQTAPLTAHSFNRSPIKKRIVMLTKRSSQIAKAKTLVFVPLCMVCIVFFSKKGFSQKFEKNGNTVTYMGNSFELSGVLKDTILLMDPVTGTQTPKVVDKNPIPLTMNGTPIVQNPDKGAYFSASSDNFESYLVKKMRSPLSKLEDGMYTLPISDFIVDKNGKVVYFDYSDVKGNQIVDDATLNKTARTVTFNGAAPGSQAGAPTGIAPGQTFTVRKAGPQIDIDEHRKQELFEVVCDILNENHLFTPAMQNGEPVVALDNSVFPMSTIKVKDHKVYIRKDGKYVEVQ